MAKYILFVAIIALVAIAVSAEKPENSDNTQRVFCTKEYFPVCGSDGKTYGNKCEFDNAKRIKQDLTFQAGSCDEIRS